MSRESDERVREWETVSIRLPKAQKDRLVTYWKQFDFQYHAEHGEEIDKNRTFHPALVRAAFTNQTLEEVLAELIEDGAEEIDFSNGEL